MGFFKNGYIEYATIVDGGLDEFNRPLPAIIEWSQKIPCHVMTYNHRNDGVVTDGIFTNSSYKVWLETYYIRFENFNIERVRVWQNQRNLGEWQVQNVNYPKMSGRIELLLGNRINRIV